MPDKKLIYVEELQKVIVEDKQIRGPAFAAIMRHLSAVPAVDAVEVVHGRWENIRFITTGDGRKRIGDCSSCKSIEQVRNYCPNCGAKMDGGNEDV